MLLQGKEITAELLLAGLTFCGGLAALLLPFETAGRELKEGPQSDNKPGEKCGQGRQRRGGRFLQIMGIVIDCGGGVDEDDEKDGGDDDDEEEEEDP